MVLRPPPQAIFPKWLSLNDFLCRVVTRPRILGRVVLGGLFFSEGVFPERVFPERVFPERVFAERTAFRAPVALRGLTAFLA
jgi:hypothetical protein